MYAFYIKLVPVQTNKETDHNKEETYLLRNMFIFHTLRICYVL
jgi:hypothetical protein